MRFEKINMFNYLIKFWQFIRTISGDNAYEQYLNNNGSSAPRILSRQEFFILKENQKWNKINRCC